MTDERSRAVRSRTMMERACQLFPGGVNSPVRAFRAVGGDPIVMASGAGARVTDVDGHEYIDLLASWGPLILGHAHPAVVRAISEAAARGTSFGAPTEHEVRLAEIITTAMPSLERLRFVSSGTEAAMSALRLARAATNRSKVLKFDGCYHGHSDALLVAAGSGVLTLGLPASAGVPASWTTDTLSVPYNDLAAAEQAFARYPGEIAAIIVEPVAGNMGVVPSASGFLAGLRALASAHGSILIFDEVITGFRVGPGGAQGKFGIRPDLTCLGKIIGGGMPVGAYGGRADLMHLIAPDGPVYQAGTLSGNPVAMSAGAATLELLRDPAVYERLEALGARLEAGIAAAAQAVDAPLRVQRVGSMLTPFFATAEVRDEATAKGCDVERYAQLFHGLLARGVYAAPSQFEAWFVSLAHSEADVDQVTQAVTEALASSA